MRRVMLLGFLALALPTAALASSTDPITIDFGVGSGGGPNPSYEGSTLDTSTAFDFGTGPFVVIAVGPSDQSGLTEFSSTVNLMPTSFVYGSGDSGPITPLTKSWTGTKGSFSETFTSFTANRSSANAITLDLSGTLSGPGNVNEPITAILTANQAHGPSGAVSWTLTETAEGVTPIPEPGTLSLLGAGLISLAGVARRKLKFWT